MKKQKFIQKKFLKDHMFLIKVLFFYNFNLLLINNFIYAYIFEIITIFYQLTKIY